MNSELSVSYPTSAVPTWVPGLEHPDPSSANCCGSGTLIMGHYGGVAPTITPDTFPVQAKDLDSPFATWWWDGVSWT